jgi:hypothetical protein
MNNHEVYFHTYVNTLIYMNGTHILDAIHTYLYDIHLDDDYKTIPCIRMAYNTAINAQHIDNVNPNININNVNPNNININNDFDTMLTSALNYTHTFIQNQQHYQNQH